VARSQQAQDIEGVFILRDGQAYFVPVEVGITGQEHFEVISGIQAGDTVVAGPYQRIRELNDGDPVRRMEEESEAGAARGSVSFT
jgi:HlyD family secretion protein